MDQVPGHSSPPAPTFGVANSENGQLGGNKFINIDEIFADCFMGSDNELLGITPGTLALGNNSAAASSGTAVTSQGLPGQISGFNGTGRIIPPQIPGGMVGVPPYMEQMHQTNAVVGQTSVIPNTQVRARGAATTADKLSRSALAAGLDEEDDDDDKGKRGKRMRQSGRNMTEQQRLERRERNREHAKRSRVRKKFLLESLQKSVTALQEENEKLRNAIRQNLGSEQAKELLTRTETSSLIANTPGDATKVLDDPDYSLVKALQTAQQNFVITDPTLPDNPIVFASQGFLELTGYTLDQILGRNCRFLQGPDTDPKAVEKIRKAIEQGSDTSVCIRNYRVDGAMFWNQFFIAALRDSEGTVINYVGVQCRVNDDFVRAVQKHEREEAEEEAEEGEAEEDEEGSDAEHPDAVS
ncbi:unnamed protein product [Choristocarpus tenellus]